MFWTKKLPRNIKAYAALSHAKWDAEYLLAITTRDATRTRNTFASYWRVR